MDDAEIGRRLNDHSWKNLLEQKVITKAGDGYEFLPTFQHVLMEYARSNLPAKALILAVHSYCPEIDDVERSLICVHITQILEKLDPALGQMLQDDLGRSTTGDRLTGKALIDVILTRIQNK